MRGTVQVARRRGRTRSWPTTTSTPPTRARRRSSRRWTRPRRSILEEERDAWSSRRSQRLEDGKYGICVDCGKEIPAARLEALPEAIRCVEDQRRYEAQAAATATGPGPAVASAVV